MFPGGAWPRGGFGGGRSGYRGRGRLGRHRGRSQTMGRPGMAGNPSSRGRSGIVSDPRVEALPPHLREIIDGAMAYGMNISDYMDDVLGMDSYDDEICEEFHSHDINMGSTPFPSAPGGSPYDWLFWRDPAQKTMRESLRAAAAWGWERIRGGGAGGGRGGGGGRGRGAGPNMGGVGGPHLPGMGGQPGFGGHPGMGGHQDMVGHPDMGGGGFGGMG